MYVKDKLRDKIYAVISKYGNNLMMIDAETASKPWVIILYTDLHPDDRFYEVPCDYRDHQEKDTERMA